MKNLKITQSITDRQDASLNLYLKEVSKIPMITAEEEVELAIRIKKGDKSAIDKLVISNLRFVVSVAKQYQYKGLPLVDLIQFGTIGLLEAVPKWDETKGFKFISYAVWWIRQSIIKALSNNCRTVRVPVNQIVNMNKINKVVDNFEQTLNRPPSLEEISNATNIEVSKISYALATNNKTTSLDTPFKDDDCGTLIDIIPNKNADKADSFIESNKSKIISEVLNQIPERYGDVIRMSIGIGMEPMQKEEIANRFGIGVERVRQLYHEALNFIKSNYSNVLKELL